MISATMRSCTSGNATSHELKHAGGHDARAPGRSSFRAFSPPPAVLGRASREQLAASQATPLEASRRGFGNRLFALHVFNSTLFFFSEHAHRFRSHERQKKRKQKRHTHENTRTDSAHALGSSNVHPHSGTRADAARCWRRRASRRLGEGTFIRRGMHPLAEHCTPSLFNRVQRLGLRHKVQ